MLNNKEIQSGCLFQASFHQHLKTGFWDTVSQKLIQIAPELENQWRRVHHYYLPLFFWIWEGIELHSASPCLIGINGGVGIGKSTLCRLLTALLKAFQMNTAYASIDDFYLTRQAQIELSASYPSNPLLQKRSFPGTHDLGLAYDTLNALKNHTADMVMLPRYDKSANQGEGERLNNERWDTVQLPLDIFLLEGWMLGFPQRKDTDNLSKNLKEVNAFLGDYEPLVSLIDRFIFLQASQDNFVVPWRVEAEVKQLKRTQSGLKKSEIRDFVTQALPAYACWVPGLIARLGQFKDYLHCEIGNDRLPIRRLSPI